jgi:hypothetical protein
MITASATSSGRREGNPFPQNALALLSGVKIPAFQRVLRPPAQTRMPRARSMKPALKANSGKDRRIFHPRRHSAAAAKT